MVPMNIRKTNSTDTSNGIEQMSKVLVLGASGATGSLLVQQLLDSNIQVVAIVRNLKTLNHKTVAHPNLQVIEATISDVSENELTHHLNECDAVLCCLGHNLTFKGIFGNPRLLVTDAVIKITRTIESMELNKKVKFILINTTGNSNRDIPEIPPLSQRIVISLLRLLLPPHVDNEKAADFLRLNIGKNHKHIEWVAVRPDSLTDEDNVTEYDTYSSPTRNAIFDSAPTSRINVANFMLNLVTNDNLWNEWKGQMPVINNHAEKIT
jgi:nucleoside-diphosphate-sugar epimerase